MNMQQKDIDPIDSEQRFADLLPTDPYFSRISKVIKAHWSQRLLKWLGGAPGLGFLRRSANKPRLMPLASNAGMMQRWYHKPYGTPDKPAILEEIPWDYVEQNQEEIPFFGLRDYWYPALTADELPHNESRAVQMLGDNIVLFRDGNGGVCALENRCTHRNALLSLGQTNVIEVGTITCRYHGATFDGKGNCVAFLGDGPNSSMCGNKKVQARAYPAQEINGVIFVWMGEGEPQDIMENIPRAPEALAPGHPFAFHKKVEYSHLNLLDNAADHTHVGCLHRTCYLFGDQKMAGGVAFEEIDRGVHIHLDDEGGHGGDHAIDEIEWHLPNMVFHGREFMGGKLNGLLFWWVPRDAGTFTAWMVGSGDMNKISRRGAARAARLLGNSLESTAIPGLACFVGGDAPMQQSQGRIVRWDRENLVRGDRAVVRCRQMMKDTHKAEIAARKAAGHQALRHRVERPLAAHQVIQTPQ